jgi:hypothetical protein
LHYISYKMLRCLQPMQQNWNHDLFGDICSSREYVHTQDMIHCSNMLAVAPWPTCVSLFWAENITFIFSIPPTTLLFFLRLRAVFLRRRITVAIFAFLWTSVPVTAFWTARLVLSGLPTEDRCKSVLGYVTGGTQLVSLWTNTIYSTLVFVAISWRLLALSRHGQNIPVTRAFIRGMAGSRIASALLREGQVYYLWVPFVVVS